MIMGEVGLGKGDHHPLHPSRLSLQHPPSSQPAPNPALPFRFNSVSPPEAVDFAYKHLCFCLLRHHSCPRP